MKAIGFLHGLAGDLIMCEAAIREFKKKYPNSHFTFACSEKHKGILELFNNHYGINDFHVWEGGDHGFTQNDKDFIRNNNFDLVFNPLSPHTSSNWYNKFHYIQETLLMLGFDINTKTSTQLYLPPPTESKIHSSEKNITIAAWPSRGVQLEKTMQKDKWEYLVKELNKKGYDVYQLGGKFDLPINNAIQLDLSFLDAAKLLYTSKLSITTDTSWAWIASAYQHNNIGLYGLNYPDMIFQWSHIPTNPNSKYIIKDSVQNINPDDILKII